MEEDLERKTDFSQSIVVCETGIYTYTYIYIYLQGVYSIMMDNLISFPNDQLLVFFLLI
jgi:hypothetical protein